MLVVIDDSVHRFLSGSGRRRRNELRKRILRNGRVEFLFNVTGHDRSSGSKNHQYCSI